MKFGIVFTGGYVLATMMALQPGVVNAGNEFGITERDSGHCTLINEESDQEMYRGKCSIKETVNGEVAVYEIQMGSEGTHLFATTDGGKIWMSDSREVDFEDHGDSATFRWGVLYLKVTAD